MLLRSNPDLAGPPLPKPTRRTGRVPSEMEEQQAVFLWAEKNTSRWPELRWLFHVPNGEFRDKGTADLLQQAGVKAGVPDLCMPVPRRGADGRVIHGLWLELKRADHSNSPSPEQRAWLNALRGHGYMAVVVFGVEEAIQVLEHYLSLEV